MTDEFTTMIRPHIRDGYRAAREGKPASANPWRPETVGGHAWALGWNIGSLPRWVRWMFARWV